MAETCIVTECNNQRDEESGVGLYSVPYSNDERPEAKKRRKRWIDFIELHRDPNQKWPPSAYALVCSDHFLPDDFSRLFGFWDGQNRRNQPRLKRDRLGVEVFPTVVKPIKRRQIKSPTATRVEEEVSILRCIFRALKATVFNFATFI